MNLSYIDPAAFAPARNANAPRAERLAAIATMNRLNALTAIKRAGSGHIGSSFSSLDIFTLLYEEILTDKDCFFSSKGHDAPGQYAAMAAAGILPVGDVLNLRRLDGLPGHPEVGTPGVVASTGSLGMGLSKARGMALGKRLRGEGGRIHVMLGDGELQEGQNYESLRSIANEGLSEIVAIVDANRIQSDKYVRVINDLGDVDAKLAAFGWDVRRVDGHDFEALSDALSPTGRPLIVIADTIKGRGVSFMEALPDDADPAMVYRWHSGAPADAAYLKATDELIGRVRAEHEAMGLSGPDVSVANPGKPSPLTAASETLGPVQGSVAKAIGEELVALGRVRQDLVVLDADLSDDCGLREFEAAFPERFVENGIAEQDMVSTAGALAGQGFLPVCASFASFLCARANEQIYNNTCEGRRLIYIGQYAGVLPAAAGYSHQSVRDIALMAHMKDVVVLQPGSLAEARAAIRWAVEDARQTVYIRSLIIPPPSDLPTAPDGLPPEGRGVLLGQGRDATLVAYGPVMLNEMLKARALLVETGISVSAVALPWLNRLDLSWFLETVADAPVFVLEDHAPTAGLGDGIAKALAADPDTARRRALHIRGVEGLPACGQPGEVLARHGLDANSIADWVRAQIVRRGDTPGG